MIEFWASWCPHCTAQEESWASLIQAHRDDATVAFVSVCVDDDRERWKKALEERSAPRENEFRVWAPGGFESEPYRAFGVSGVPRYFILDAQGNFIDLDAPRPTAGLSEALSAHSR